jgi:hypothetical protein
MPTTEKIAFSIFHATGAPLSKSFRLSPAGLITTTGGRLLRGEMRTIYAPDMQTIANYLDGLTAQDAVAWGVSEHDRAYILPERKVAQGATIGNNGVPTIARTREYYSYPAGPGVMMLDYDPAPGVQALTASDLLANLYALCPALEAAPLIVRPSASAHIWHGEHELRGARGVRVLVQVADATDIPRAGDVLCKRAWLAGLGRIEISRAGTLLERAIIDATVWQPERLDFCGPAAVHAPLTQHRAPTEVLRSSTVSLDTTTALPLLSPAESLQYETAANAAKAALEPEAAIAHEAWLERRVKAGLAVLPKKTTAAQRRTRASVIRATCTIATQEGVLHGDYLITLATGECVTVADILADPTRYDEVRCCDPLDPEYRGDTRVAIIYAASANPIIYSHAHGETRYYLQSRLDIEPKPVEADAQGTPPKSTISDAINSSAKAVLILAPPGSGKSTAAFVRAHAATQVNEAFAYVANNKTDLGKATEKLVAAVTDPAIVQHPVTLQAARLAEKKIFIVQSGKTKLGAGESAGKAARKPGKQRKQVFTHKTYLERKGVGSVFYPFLRWVQQHRPFLIIDEINDFIAACSRLIPIEIASTSYRAPGAARAKRRYLRHCPGHKTHSYCCASCDLRKAKIFTVDEYGNAQIRFPGGFVGGEADLELAPDWSQYPVRRKIEVPECNFDVHFIRQPPQAPAALTAVVKCTYEEDEYFAGVADLEHAIAHSYEPAFIQIYPVLVTFQQGEKVFIPLREEFERSGLIEIKDGVPMAYNGDALPARSYIKQPSRGCGLYLHLIDLYPLQIIAKYASGVRFLTTLRNSETIEVLESVFQNLEKIEIVTTAARLEGVLIMGYGKEISQKKAAAGLMTDTSFKTLQFEPCAGDAKRVFEATPASARASLYCSGEQLQRRKYTMGESNCLIANSFGAFGKAVDLVEFDVCVVNANINKPLIAGARHADRAEIVRRHKQARLELVDQNIGRIRRGDGRKALLVHNIEQDEFEKLLNLLKLGNTFESVTAVYVTSSGSDMGAAGKACKSLALSEDNVYKSLREYILYNAVYCKEEKPKKPAKRKLSRKQRIACRAELEKQRKEKREAKLAAKVALARGLWTAGKTPNAIAKKLHLERFGGDEELLKFWAKVMEE